MQGALVCCPGGCLWQHYNAEYGNPHRGSALPFHPKLLLYLRGYGMVGNRPVLAVTYRKGTVVMRLWLELFGAAIFGAVIAVALIRGFVRRAAFQEGLTAAAEPDENWTEALHDEDVWLGRGMWTPTPALHPTLGEGWRVHLNGDMVPPKALISTHTWVGDLVAGVVDLEPV